MSMQNSWDLKFVYSFSQNFAQETMAPSDMPSILYVYLCFFVYLDVYIFIYSCCYLFFFITICGEQPGIEFPICCLVALLRYQFAQDWTHLHCPPTTFHGRWARGRLLLLSCGQCSRNCVESWIKGSHLLSWGIFQVSLGSLRRLTMSSYKIIVVLNKRCGGNQIPNQRMADKPTAHMFGILFDTGRQSLLLAPLQDGTFICFCLQHVSYCWFNIFGCSFLPVIPND